MNDSCFKDVYRGEIRSVDRTILTLIEKGIQ